MISNETAIFSMKRVFAPPRETIGDTRASVAAFPKGRRMKSRSLTKASFLAVCILVCSGAAALAIDCKRASTTVETAICEDDELKSKDAALSDAYFKLLKQTTDPRIHNLLIFSQKRWLKAREDTFRSWKKDLPELSFEDLSPGIDQRLDELTGKYGSYIERIASALKFASRFSGGSYAGSRIWCNFVGSGAGRYYRNCGGDITFQNGDRICRLSKGWASGHWTDFKTVGNVVGGVAKIIATCSEGYANSSHECPEDSASGAPRPGKLGWNFRPDPRDLEFPPFRKGTGAPSAELVDPDVNVADGRGDAAWLTKCLTDPNYPMSEPHHN